MTAAARLSRTLRGGDLWKVLTIERHAFPEVFLYVRASNHGARLLYRRTGFTDAGVKPGYYQPSGTDAIVMRLPIPARSCPATEQAALAHVDMRHGGAVG